MRLFLRIGAILIAALIVTGATMALTPANSAQTRPPQGDRPPRTEGGPRGERGGGFAIGEVVGHLAVVGVVTAPFAVASVAKSKRRTKAS
jgi:hypothetical protein